MGVNAIQLSGIFDKVVFAVTQKERYEQEKQDKKQMLIDEMKAKAKTELKNKLDEAAKLE